MNEVFIGATYDVFVGDCKGVNTCSHALQHVHHFKTLQAPDLKTKQTTKVLITKRAKKPKRCACHSVKNTRQSEMQNKKCMWLDLLSLYQIPWP